jgi:exosortase H (IPTLxxWG-CTERM-specific)
LPRSKRLHRVSQPAESQTAQAVPAALAIRPPLPRFAIGFAVCATLGFGLLRAPWIDPAVMVLNRALVAASATLINIAGGGAAARDDVLRSRATGFAIQMANGCNGIHVLIVLWSAMVAFPASPKLKIKGLLAGTLLILGVNFARFISLFLLGQYAPAWFDFAHVYFWESMIMLDALVVFWLWARYVFRSAVVSHAGA